MSSVPVHDFEPASTGGWRPAPQSEPVPLPPVIDLPDPVDLRRVVVSLVGDELLEVARVDGREQAVRVARETIQLIEDAQDAGQWPELAGRFIRPDAIVSIDVQTLAD